VGAVVPAALQRLLDLPPLQRLDLLLQGGGPRRRQRHRLGVGEGEILGPKLIDVLLENESKEETLLALARQGRGFYVPSLYHVSYKDDGAVASYAATEEGVPARVGAQYRPKVRRRAACAAPFVVGKKI